MRAGGTIGTDLVSAAQADDRRAMDQLVTSSLPLVYSVVRQVLDDEHDVDDVVQDIMVRALSRLSALRRPESFRSWLTAIAVHEIGTHLHRRKAGARRSAPLDEAAGTADPGGGLEDVTTLRADLSRQRRQVRHAGYWLDPDDRVVLSLWLLELAGELTRAELATALGTGVAHAGVRVQRMRQHLQVSRELVTVLEGSRGCAALDAVLADWDGVPSPLWRKRLARHIRSCDVCGHSAEAMVPVERLLPELVLLPVPIGLAAAVLLKSGAAVTTSSAVLAGASTTSGGLGIKAGLVDQLLQAAVAHPIVAASAVAAVAAGAAVTATNLPEPPPPRPAVIAAPPSSRVRPTPSTAAPAAPSRRPSVARTTPPTTGRLVPGRPVSLQSADRPGLFVTTVNGLGALVPARADSSATVRRQATFTAIAGVANSACFSFRAQDGRYLRHASWRFRLDPDQGTPLFRGDATFCVRTGTPAGAITLEASNYPGWFLHRRDDQLWVDQTDGSATFRAESSFRVGPGLAD
jgi:RNA polymerase sigma factor (sigma-70 family)